MAKVIPWLVISIVFFVAGSINNKASGSSGASADQKQQNSLDKSAAMDNAMSMHGSTSTGHDWNEDDIRILRRLWIESLPDTPPDNSVFYCGSGVTSIMHLLAMEHIGISGARLYAGSWSEWITDKNRPIAVI